MLSVWSAFGRCADDASVTRHHAAAPVRSILESTANRPRRRQGWRAGQSLVGVAIAAALTLSACGGESSAVEISIGAAAIDGDPELGGTYVIGDELWSWSHRDRAIAIVDPATGAVTQTLDFDDVSYVNDMVEHDGLVYMPSINDGLIVVDIQTRERVATLSSEFSPGYDGVAIANARVFASGDEVDVFDIETRELIGQIGAGSFLRAPVLVDGQVWVASAESEAPRTVTVIDPVELTTRFIDLDTSLANPPAVGDGVAWITHFSDFGEDGIFAIDTTTLEVIDERRHGSAGWAIAINGNLWTSDFVDPTTGEILVLDTAGTVLARFEVAPDVVEPVVGDGIAWVPNGSENEVIAIDLTTLTVVSTTGIKGEPLGAAFVDGRAWIDDDSGTLSAIESPAAE